MNTIVMDMGKTRLKYRAANFCMMHSSLFEYVDIIEFQTTGAYSRLDLTGI
jgi:hypothetical protein